MKNTPSSTKTAPISIRLPKARTKQLDKIASRLDRSRSWVIAEAIDSYVDWQQEQIAMIEEGIRQADAGMGVPHEEAVKNFQAFRKNQKLLRSRSKTGRKAKR